MTRDPAQELYTLLEREVRTPREKLPLDAFLPAQHADLGRRQERTRIVVRCTAYELSHESDEVAADLIALGVPSRVP